MRLVAVEEVRPSMRLARSIYRADGRLLLGKGMELKGGYIARLQKLGVSRVYVLDGLADDIELADVITEETRLRAMLAVRQALVEAGRSEAVFEVRMHRDLLKSIAEELVDDLFTRRDIVISLQDLKTFDTYTYAHSVNSCILGLVVGRALGYNKFRLRDLGAGMLMHDIGKTAIPEAILNKPGPFSPEEFALIKKHPAKGFEILSRSAGVCPMSRLISLEHHEKYDGTGYPRGLAGNDIRESSRIAAVADVYDALTSDRPYRRAFPSHLAIQEISRLSGTHFDPGMVEILLRHVAPYPVGTTVELSDGRFGVVLDVRSSAVSKPSVRIFRKGADGVLQGEEVVDLSEHDDIQIVNVPS